MSPSVRIAAVQARPQSELFDDMWNGGDVAHAVDLLEAAARAGAACVCFPELYPRVGEAEIRAAARRLGVFVVAGLIEGTRTSWHNTSTVIGPDGSVYATNNAALYCCVASQPFRLPGIGSTPLRPA